MRLDRSGRRQSANRRSLEVELLPADAPRVMPGRGFLERRQCFHAPILLVLAAIGERTSGRPLTDADANARRTGVSAWRLELSGRDCRHRLDLRHLGAAASLSVSTRTVGAGTAAPVRREQRLDSDWRAGVGLDLDALFWRLLPPDVRQRGGCPSGLPAYVWRVSVGVLGGPPHPRARQLPGPDLA